MSPVAVPSAVAHATVTSWPDTASRETVNWAAWPSATVKSSMDSAGVASSSVIVASPVASPRKALVGLLSLIVKVSFASSMASPVVCTEAVQLREPAWMVADWPVRAV